MRGVIGMKKLWAVALLMFAGIFPAAAYAEPGVFKLSLWDQYSLTIPNHPDEIQGLDLGIGSHTGAVTGLQADLMWAQTDKLTGVSFSWGISTTGFAQGLQWAFVNMANTITGAQLGGVNMTSEMTGAQVGGVNMSSRSVVGAQVGFYNQAEYINGVQFGLLNYARYIYGLQIGFINIAENGYLPAMVFVNGRF